MSSARRGGAVGEPSGARKSPIRSTGSKREGNRSPRDHGDLNKTARAHALFFVLVVTVRFPRLENLITSHLFAPPFHQGSIGSGREIISDFFSPLLSFFLSSCIPPISHDGFPLLPPEPQINLTASSAW